MDGQTSMFFDPLIRTLKEEGIDGVSWSVTQERLSFLGIKGGQHNRFSLKTGILFYYNFIVKIKSKVARRGIGGENTPFPSIME